MDVHPVKKFPDYCVSMVQHRVHKNSAFIYYPQTVNQVHTFELYATFPT